MEHELQTQPHRWYLLFMQRGFVVETEVKSTSFFKSTSFISDRKSCEYFALTGIYIYIELQFYITLYYPEYIETQYTLFQCIPGNIYYTIQCYKPTPYNISSIISLFVYLAIVVQKLVTQCIVFNIHCTVYIVQCTMYILDPTWLLETF